MEGLELLCFQIISAAGTARSDYIEAIQEVKKGNTDKAEELMKEGEKQFLQGHEAHALLLQLETSVVSMNSTVLVMHAEDQLMSAETFQLFANEFIEIYCKMIDLEQRLE